MVRVVPIPIQWSPAFVLNVWRPVRSMSVCGAHRRSSRRGEGSANPALQCRLTKAGQPIDARLRALEPAIHIAQQNPPRIGCHGPEVARAARAGTQYFGAGKCLLPVGGHHRLTGRAASGWITPAPCMFAEQSCAPALIGARTVRPGLGEYFDPVAGNVDGHQTQADQPAETMHAWIAVTSAPRRRHRKPDFISHPHAVHRLQQQIKIEAKLHFHDRQKLRRLSVLHGNDVAAVDLALHLEACCFQEALDGRIQRGLEHAAQTVMPDRAAAISSVTTRQSRQLSVAPPPGTHHAAALVATERHEAAVPPWSQRLFRLGIAALLRS